MSKRQHDRQARSAEQVAGTATSAAGAAAGSAAHRAGAAVQRAGTVLEEQSRTTAPAVGSAVGTAVEGALDAVDTARAAVERVGSAARGVTGGLVETVSGLVEEPGARGAAALDALRGGSPAPARRLWPWALVAALAGAAAGAATALLVRQLSGTDPVDAQEPHELRAVVDVPTEPVPGSTPTPAPAGPVTGPSPA